MTKLKEVTLESLGGGVIHELFARELRSVLQNIDDPNTNPKAARKITIEIAFKPHDSREMAAVTMACKSSLAGVAPTSIAIHLSRRNGQPMAYYSDPRQEEIFDRPEIVEGGRQ